MLLLVQILSVIASLAVVVIAVAVVRAMRRVEVATEHVSRLTGEIHQWIGEATELTREARATVASVHGMVAPVRRIVDRFEILGERTANLTDVVLGEVEAPIRTAVSVARGMKSATAYFMERLSNRFAHGRSATNGGSDHA